MPLPTLEYHLYRGDFERWLCDTVHDEELARRLRGVAHHGFHGESLREVLVDVVTRRVEELETLAGVE